MDSKDNETLGELPSGVSYIPDDQRELLTAGWGVHSRMRET